ncbi:hypothetical protein [Gaetbulibacter jejuensis]|uniref:Nuclear transport factor 2 family protein n=1 Tax=Gaetbulibacter jejuensis TaxID=584607 RepID=A0ABN1JLL8_9FLAO
MGKIILYSALLLLSNFGFSQSTINNKDLNSITQYYNSLQDNKQSSIHLQTLEQLMGWEFLRTETANLNNRSFITLEAVLINQWTQIEITSLELKVVSENKIIASGILSGRQPTECDYISTSFEHLWIKKSRTLNQITQHENSRYHRWFRIHR